MHSKAKARFKSGQGRCNSRGRVLGQMQQQCGEDGNCFCNHFAVEFSPEVNGEAAPAQICSENSTRCSQKTKLT